ncbi:MAG: FkbM family methyltransferase [Syntrophales bacterium]
MDTEELKSLVRQFPFLYLWMRKIGQGVSRGMIRLFGLGYEKRIITGGPIQGLSFLAAKRVFYSKWFWDGTFEKEMCAILRTSTTIDAVCYDIGANIGYHALVMAEAAEKGQVYAFEPIPQVCDILQKNIDINHKQNITIVQKVVAGAEGKIQLGLDTSIDQASLKFAINDEIHRLCEIIECDAITIDGFVAEGNAPPSLIKIDVEGAEVDVLQGARRALAQCHPLVLCETHGQMAARGVYKILCEYGYELFIIHDGVRSINSLEDMPNNMYEGHVFAKPIHRS